MKKQLKDLLSFIGIDSCSDEIQDVMITSVVNDSRKAAPGSVFVAVKGNDIDGHKFIGSAIESGAECIICQDDSFDSVKEQLDKRHHHRLVHAKDTRIALAILCQALYDDISKSFDLVGVTGTNGKTTITYMMSSIWNAGGDGSGIIGTTGIFIGQKFHPANTTTPDIVQIYSYLDDMKQSGINKCSIEVSSHSLVQNRVLSLDFNVMIFTNLSEEHLDYHKTMDEYLKAKLTAFDLISGRDYSLAIINRDIPEFETITSYLKKIAVPYKTYGLSQDADFRAVDVNLSESGSEFSVIFGNQKLKVNLAMPGEFNVYNALSVITAAVHLGISGADIQNGLDKCKVPGRMEKVSLADVNSGEYPPFSVIVDYAVTDDALIKVINTLRPITKNRIIVVFGAGGDRVKSKRPLMGKAVGENADFAIITSDNPRTENPESIIDNIEAGIKPTGGKYIRITDRKAAIYEAVNMANSGDCILIAGKGHEDYQILGKTKIHFDDREHARDALLERYKKVSA